MRSIFSLVAVIGLFLLADVALAAEAPKAEMVCNDLMLITAMDSNDKPVLESTGFTIQVFKSEQGKRGWISFLIDKEGKSNLEQDVEISVVQPAQAPNFVDLLASLYPAVKLADVESVRVANIGVQANLEDGGGVLLMYGLGADGRVLAKLTQVGWGFGKCSL
jgi:hypothetical protein